MEWSPGLQSPWTHAVNDQNGVSITATPVAGNMAEILARIPQNGASRLFARVSAE